jgi:phosphotransferase system HPr-like phosphotransfer protein
MERENSKLSELRRATSIPLHLLEAARWLSHFYERHESDINENSASNKIASLVDRKEVLDRIMNFCFYYSNYYIQKGNSLAEDIMSAYVEKVQYELPVPKPLGFHAKPSTYVSLIVNEHGTDVEMIVDGQRFNAKSVINLLMAAGIIVEKNYEKVTFEGDKQVLDDLKILAEHNYCEDNDIPVELSYLRILRNMPRV